MSDYLDDLKRQADAVAAGAPLSPPGESSYMDALRREADATAQQALRSNLNQALPTNPSEFAAQRAAADRLGVAPGVVAAMLQEMSFRDRLNQIEHNVRDAPVLQRMLTAEDFAKLTHGDTDILGDIERGIGSLAAYMTGATPTGGFIGTIKAMPEWTTAGLSGVAQAAMETIGATGEAITGKGNLFTEAAQFWQQNARTAKAAAKEIDSGRIYYSKSRKGVREPGHTTAAGTVQDAGVQHHVPPDTSRAQAIPRIGGATLSGSYVGYDYAGGSVRGTGVVLGVHVHGSDFGSHDFCVRNYG